MWEAGELRALRPCRILGCGIAFTVMAICASASLMARGNDDVVIMKNGDRILCEIKRLENGVLYISPPYTLDTYGVDWTRVERVESKQAFTVTMTDGNRYTGRIEKTAAKEHGARDFTISRQGFPLQVKSNEIYGIRQVEQGFWNQQTGMISGGFSFTQGNSSAQLSIAGNTDYRQERYTLHLDGSATFNSQSNARTARYTTNFEYDRYIRGPWYTGTLVNLLRSDQQELRLRASLGQGMGRDFVRTYRTNFSALAGAVFTNEFYVPQSGLEPHRRNAEGVVGLTFSTYRFKYTQVSNQTFVYPNFSTPGRVRVSTTSYFKFRIARNLDWIFTVYENFDSEPPINAPRNDAGVTTSLGWTF